MQHGKDKKTILIQEDHALSGVQSFIGKGIKKYS